MTYNTYIRHFIVSRNEQEVLFSPDSVGHFYNVNC